MHFGGALWIFFIMVRAPGTETGHIWGFLALFEECVGVNGEGVAETYFRRFV